MVIVRDLEPRLRKYLTVNHKKKTRVNQSSISSSLQTLTSKAGSAYLSKNFSQLPISLLFGFLIISAPCLWPERHANEDPEESLGCHGQPLRAVEELEPYKSRTIGSSV